MTDLPENPDLSKHQAWSKPGSQRHGADPCEPPQKLESTLGIWATKKTAGAHHFSCGAQHHVYLENCGKMHNCPLRCFDPSAPLGLQKQVCFFTKANLRFLNLRLKSGVTKDVS